MKTRMRLFLLAALTLTAQYKIAAGAVPQREPVRRALTWLVKAMDGKAWDENPHSRANQEGLRRIATLMTAWLLEVNDDFAEFQAVRLRMRRQADESAAKARLDGAEVFSNWIQGFAALYVYERSLRDQRPHPALDLIARGFLDRQNAEGGWCHGEGKVPIPFYASTMIATTNLALFALAAAGREKTSIVQEVDYEDAVAEGLKLLRDVQGPHGGMPYGGRPCRIGCEAGRTVSMLLALAALQRTDTALFRRAAAYVLRNMESIPHGHSSMPLHVALGGLGSFILSDDAWRLYEVKVLKHVRQAQRLDGSFFVSTSSWDRPPDVATLPPEQAGDALFSAAYATALCAVGLSADRSAVARQLRLNVPFSPPEGSRAQEQALPLAWQVGLDRVVGLTADAKTIVARQDDGTLNFFVDGGKLLGKTNMPGQVMSDFKMSGGDVYVLSTSEEAAFQSNVDGRKPPVQASRIKYMLSCCSLRKQSPVWRAEVDGPVHAWSVDDEHVLLLALDGKLTVVATSTGQTLHRFPPELVLGNCVLQTLPQDRYAFAGGSRLKVYSGKGDGWEDKNRAGRGVTPAAFSALAASTGRLYTGGTDGQVACREQATGKVLWRVAVGSRIQVIHATDATPARTIAVVPEGVVYGLLQNGKTAWRTDVGSGVEREGEVVSRLTAAGLLVGQAGRVTLVDIGDGRVRNVLHAKRWTATDHEWVVWSDGRLCGYRLDN